MHYSKDGVYNLYRTIKNFLKNPTKGKYKSLMENDFNYFTQHYYNQCPNWDKGAVYFVPLANALNCGKVSIMELCSAFIGDFIIKNKTTTIKVITTIDNVKEFVKNAILDGVSPNEFSPADRLMREKAAEMGLNPLEGK